MDIMSYIIALENFDIFNHNVKIFIAILIFSNAEVNIVVPTFFSTCPINSAG